MKRFCTSLALLFSAFVCIAFIVPLVFAFFPLFKGHESLQKTYLHFLPIVHTSFYSLSIGFASTFIAILIGLPMAFFVSQRKFFGRNFLIAFSAVPICIPSLLIALGFVLIFGINGSVNKFLKNIFSLEFSPITFLYSFWGIIIAQGFYNFPLIMRTVSDSWSLLSVEEEHAARLLGASEWRIFKTITIHKLIPSLLSSSVIVFLFCFFSFIIVLLFGTMGGETLEVAIYQSARSTLDFRMASILALIETAIAFFVVLLHTKVEKYSSISLSPLQKTFLKKRGIGQGLFFSKWQSFFEKNMFFFLLCLIVLFFIMPLLSIGSNAFFSENAHAVLKKVTLKNFAVLIGRQSFRTSFFHTIEIGLATATFTTCTGLCAALFIHALDPLKKSKILRSLPLLPMAVSSVVIGFGLTVVVHRGSPLLLVIAQSSLYWPFAFRQIIHAVENIPQATIDAGRLLSGEPLDLFFKVEIPLVKRSIFSAFCFCFAISCGDASLPLILALPRFDTLALLTYRLAGAYRFAEACACGVILAILTAGVFYISDRVYKTTIS